MDAPKKEKAKKSIIEQMATPEVEGQQSSLPSALQGQVGGQTTSKSQVAKASQGLDAHSGGTLAAPTTEEVELNKMASNKKNKATEKVPPQQKPTPKASAQPKPVKEKVVAEFSAEETKKMDDAKAKKKAQEEAMIASKARQQVLTTPEEGNFFEQTLWGKGSEKEKDALSKYKQLVEQKEKAKQKAYPEADFFPHLQKAVSYGATPMAQTEMFKGILKMAKGVADWTGEFLADRVLAPAANLLPGDKDYTRQAVKDYKAISSKVKREEQKVLKPTLDKQETYLAGLKAKRDKTLQESMEAAKAGHGEVTKAKMNDLKNIRDAVELAEEGAQSLREAYEGNDSLLDAGKGLVHRWGDIISIGIAPLMRDLGIAGIASKPSDQRTESENDLLYAYANRNSVNGSSVLQNTWYGAGKGSADSFTMMAGMILSEGGGALVKKGVESTVKAGVKQMLKKGAIAEAEAVAQAAGKQLTKEGAEIATEHAVKRLGLNIAKKIPGKGKVGYVVDKLGKSLELGYTVPFQPMTYQTAVRNYIGDTEIVKDKDGKETVLVRDGLAKYYHRIYDSTRAGLDKEYKELESKPNKTEEDRAAMAKISEDIDHIDSEIERVRPRSAAHALIYGATETWAETWTEKVLGDVTQDAFGKLAKTKFGGFVADSKLGKGYRNVNYAIEAGKAKFSKSGIGKLSTAIAPHGISGVYHGLPSEMWEEVVREAIPSIDDSYAEKIKHLTDPHFYSDVAAQTLIVSGVMGGGAGIIGIPNSIKNAKANSQAIDARKSIRALYRKMDRAVTDDQLARVASMASAGTHYDVRDYNIEITNLRRQNTEESNKAADVLEQAKFNNIAMQAVSTGTLGELKDTLNRMVRQGQKNKKEYTAPTLDNIMKAQERVAELEKAQEQYAGKKNLGAILTLTNDKVTAKNTLENLQGKLDGSKAKVKAELEQFAQDRKHNVDIDVDNLFNREFADPKDAEAYNKFLADAESHQDILPETGQYATVSWAKENVKESLKHTRNAYNYQVSKKYEQDTAEADSIREQFDSLIKEAEARGVDTPHLPLRTVLEMPTNRKGELKEDGEMIERQEAQITPEFVDNFFKRIKTKSLSKDKLSALKATYMIQAFQAEQARQARTTENISSLLKATVSQPQQVNPDANTADPIYDEEAQQDLMDHLNDQLGELEANNADPEEIAFVREKLDRAEREYEDYQRAKGQEKAPNEVVVEDVEEMEKQKAEIRTALGRSFYDFSEQDVENVWHAAKRNGKITSEMLQEMMPELGKAFSVEIANKINEEFKNIADAKSTELVPEELRENLEQNLGAISAIVDSALNSADQVVNTVETPTVEIPVSTQDPDYQGPEDTPDVSVNIVIPGVTPAPTGIDFSITGHIVPDIDVSNPATTGVPVNTPDVTTATTVSAKDMESGNFSFEPLVVINYSAETRKALKDLVEDSVTGYENEFGNRPTFKDFMAYTIKVMGFKKAELIYDSLGLGWKENGFEEYDRDGIYKHLFATAKGSLEAIDALLKTIHPELNEGAPISEDEVREITTEQAEEGVKQQQNVIGFTEENIPITATDAGTDAKSISFTFGYSAIEYKEIEDEEGGMKPVAIPTRALRQDSVVAFEDILKANKFLPGTKVPVAMAPETMWDKVSIVTGRDTNGKKIKKTYKEFFESQPVGFRETQEFIDTVPMFFFNEKGEPVAFVHDTNWFNSWNVPDPIDGKRRTNTKKSISIAHSNAIKDARAETSALRTAIFNGDVKEVTVEEKVHGAIHNIEEKAQQEIERKPLISLSDANPQSVVITQGDGELMITGMKGTENIPFDNDKRRIINMETMHKLRSQGQVKAGSVWEARRIGTDADGKETWAIFKPHEYVNQEEIETARWAWATIAAFQDDKGFTEISKNITPKYRLTKEQATIIADKIEEMTGFNLRDKKEGHNFIQLFLKPANAGKDSFSSVYDFGKRLYLDLPTTSFWKKTDKSFLNKKNIIPHIDTNGKVVSTGKTYHEYVQSTLTTGVISFNVGTEENPEYITSVQPTIRFSYKKPSAPVVAPITASIQEVERAAQEVIQELEQEKAPEKVAEEANKLLEDLGFNFQPTQGFSFQPGVLKGTKELESIYKLVPGLNIAQEQDLIETISQYGRNYLEQHIEGKVPTINEMKAIITKAENLIMESANKEVSAAHAKVSEMHRNNPTPELKAALGRVIDAGIILGNISTYWSDASLKENLGEEYNGQVSIVDKVLNELKKTTELKDKKVDPAVDDVSPETEEQGEMETDLSERLFSYEDNASLSESAKLKTTYRLRRYMSGVTRSVWETETKDGKEVRKENPTPMKGFLKFNKLMGFNETYDNLYNLLTTSGVYIEADYEMMKAKILDMKDNNPWVIELMKRFDEGDEMLRNQFVTNYRKHAVSMKFVMKETITDVSGIPSHKLQVYDANANETVKAITNTWKANLRGGGQLFKVIEGDYYINKEAAQALLDTYNKWGENGAFAQNSTPEQVREWMKAFGVDVAPGYMKDIADGNFLYQGQRIPYAKEFFEGAKSPVGQMARYLRKVVKESKEINVTEDPAMHPYTDMSAVMKATAKGEAMYTYKVFNKSFRVAGKSVSGTTNPSFATNRVDDLKRSALGDMAFINSLKSLSFSSESTILEMLTDEEYGKDFASKFHLSHLSLEALVERFTKTRTNAGITELNSLDHDMVKFGMFQDTQQGTLSKRNGFSMRVGHMLGQTMSDKTQAYAFSTGVFNFHAQSDVAFNYDANAKEVTGFQQRLKDLLYKKLVLPEMKRIAKFHANGAHTDIAGYNKAAQIFNMIPALNNIKDENGERMVAYFKKEASVEELEKLFRDQIDSTIEEVVMSLANKKIASLESLVKRSTREENKGDIISISHFDSTYLATGKGDMNAKFQTAVYDYVLNNMLFNADMFAILAGDPALYAAKQLKNEENPDNLLQDEAYIEFAQKQGVNIGKRLALLATPGTTMAGAVNQQYFQINLEDSVDISSNSKYLIKLFSGEEALHQELGNSGKTVAEALEGYTNADEATKKDTRSLLQKQFPAIADYFDIESTDAQEYTTTLEHLNIMKGYGKIPEKQYNIIAAKIKAQKDLEANADGKYKIPKSMLLTKEELNMVLQPQKPVYTGQTIDTEQDVARTIYIKSSAYPLIPQLTMGTELDNLRRKMEEIETKYNKGVRASYMTANKVGGSVFPINPLNPSSLEDAEKFMMMLDRNNYRNQQDVPFKDKSSIAMGTQMFKILFGDGVMNIPGFEVDWKEGSLTGKQLYDEFFQVFSDMMDLKKGQLFDELGLDKNGIPFDTRAYMHKLQELLKKEALDRDYPIQDIKSLDLVKLEGLKGNTYYEFTMPLWLSANSNRFESLLNAIVTKRTLSHKLPGNSFVAGSEHGYSYKEGLSGIDTSRVVFFENYNGKELQGTSYDDVDGKPVFTKAQVLVPSKFRNTDGTLIDMFETLDNGEYKYLVKEEGKPLRLRENMIDQSLLSMFSFRTPTSSHVSGSLIEVAGILPPENGDLMIVPKNFTKQKGLDFDVDKENTYQLNHHVTKSGEIKEFTEYHVEQVRKKIDKFLNSKEVQDALALEKVERSLPENVFMDFMNSLEGVFTEEEIDEVSAERDSLINQIDALKRKLKEKELKVLENKFIKIHQAVFANPHQEMQKKINKVLSMKFAQDQANLIEKVSGSATEEVPWDFTILSDQYQKEKMGLGAAGKMAIGVYSNYVTFHGLIQQFDTPSYLQRENAEGQFEKFEINIGGLESDGRLGRQTTLDGSRSVAEVYAEKQNTATDNEKEQILGRVNINSLTIGVDSLLAGLGFDKTTYTDEDGKTQDADGNPYELSVSYALLSQPIIKEFVQQMQSGMGILADYTANLEEGVVDGLRKKYPITEEVSSEILTGSALLNGLKSNGSQADVQIAALNLFLELRAAAKKVSKVQSLINTKDLGKSATEAFNKYDNLEALAETKVMTGATKLIGEYIPAGDVMGRPSPDYIPTRKYYIKPTTPQGKMVAMGISLGYNLWSDFFPYEDPYFKTIVNTIIKESTVDAEKTDKVVEAKHEIYREIKKYLYSSNNFGIFTNPAHIERQRLFFDSKKGEPAHKSLASYMNEVQRHESIAHNKLFARFTYDLQTNGLPSTIRYNNTTSDDLEEKYLYTAFAEMILEEKALPDWNGNKMTTKDLAQELISYAYLEGGVQEAIQFIKYVPLEYLKEVGRMETEKGETKFVTALEKFQRLNPSRSNVIFEFFLGKQNIDDNVITNPFITQFFQHNPDKAKKYQTSNKNFKLDPDNGRATLVNEEQPAFLTVNAKKTKSKNKKDKLDLYAHIGGGAYVKIPTLGVHGMNEYQFGTENATSLIDKTVKAPTVKNVNQVSAETNPPTAAEFLITDRPVVDILTDMSKSEIPALVRYQALAEALIPLVGDTGASVKVVDSMQDAIGKTAQGAYDSASNTIYIDRNASTNQIITFMHEAMHALTRRELEKYYDFDSDGFATQLKTSVPIPAYVTEMHMVWQEAINQSDSKKVQDVKDKIKAIREGQNVGVTQQELDTLYPLTDIFEFYEAALESRKFQEHLSTLPYKKSGKTIIDKLMDSLYKLAKALGIKEDTLSHAAFTGAMKFVEEEHKGRVTANFDVTAGMQNPPSGIDFGEQQQTQALFDRVDIQLGTPPQSIFDALSGNIPLPSDNIGEGPATGERKPSLSPKIENQQEYNTFVNERETKLPCEGGVPI